MLLGFLPGPGGADLSPRRDGQRIDVRRPRAFRTFVKRLVHIDLGEHPATWHRACSWEREPNGNTSKGGTDESSSALESPAWMLARRSGGHRDDLLGPLADDVASGAGSRSRAVVREYGDGVLEAFLVVPGNGPAEPMAARPA